MTELFDTELRSLFKLSLSILNTRYSLSKKRKELLYLERYMAIYEKMDVEEFHRDFANLFNFKRKQILKTLDDDSWLREGSIEIQFGKGVEGLEEKCKEIKIMLSHIYKCAVELRDIALKTLDNLSDELSSGNEDLTRPSFILLHLLRLFYAVSDDSDKSSLSPLIEKLERDLNVKSKLTKPLITIPNMSMDNIGDSLANLFSTLLTVAKETDIPLPPDIVPPTKEQFKAGIENVMGNPKIKGVLNSLVSGGDAKSILSNLMQTALDPETLQSMQESLIKTAEIAKENYQK